MNDIWHKPEEKQPEKGKVCIEKWQSMGEVFYTQFKSRGFIATDDPRTIGWCYIDDLIAYENELKRYSAALELIKNLSGAGMSYQDMVIECREIAKLAFDPDYNAILMGRYDEYSHKLFDILRTKGGDNE